MTPLVPQTKITREDVASAVGARRELGEELEPAVVDAFLDKVEHAIEERAKADRKRRSGPDSGQQLALSIVSIACGIPITAIAAEEAGILGILVTWIGLVAINVAHSIRR